MPTPCTNAFCPLSINPHCDEPKIIKSLITVFTLFFLVPGLKAQVVNYQYPSTIRASAFYRVSSAGKQIVVLDEVAASITAFTIIHPALLVIKTSTDLKWVDIRPKNLHIAFTFNDSSITIKLIHPCKLSIELNGKSDHPLFVFANAPKEGIPSVTDTNCTYFAAGKEYNAGRISLLSGQALYIEGGAIVHGYIDAKNAHNISVSGYGILDGSQNKDNHEYHRGINLQNCRNIAISDIILTNGTTWELVPENCEHINISNIKIVSHSDSDDGIDLVSSRHILVDNCFIRTKDDCIAIKANTLLDRNAVADDIHIQNCTIFNGPWGNGFEIGFELEAFTVSNISFSNCDIIHVEKGAALSIHNGGKSDVNHIRYKNIRIEDARGKLFDFAVFASQYSLDGPKTDAERDANYLNGAWDGVTRIVKDQKSAHANYRGKIRDVVIEDIKLQEGIFPFSIFYGLDDQHTVSNVFIKNLIIYQKKITNLKSAKFYEENTKNIVIN